MSQRGVNSEGVKALLDAERKAADLVKQARNGMFSYSDGDCVTGAVLSISNALSLLR